MASGYEFTEGNFKSTLDGEWLERAKKELHEDPKQRQSQIDTLRAWVKKLPHIKTRTDDQFLIRFLRTAKFSQLRAQQLLENFCIMYGSPSKGMMSWHTIHDPEDERMVKMLNSCVILPLPGRDDEGRRVYVERIGAWDPKECPIDDFVNFAYLLIERDLMDEKNQVSGFSFFMDWAGFSATHASYFGREMIAKSAHSMEDAFPMRFKGGHYYNMSTIFNAIFEIFKLFLKEKTKKRLHLHWADLESVKKQIPARILPTEYGGEAGTLEEIKEQTRKELLEGKEEFKRMEMIKVDDSKIPQKENTGWGGMVFGSYRKLETD